MVQAAVRTATWIAPGRKEAGPGGGCWNEPVGGGRFIDDLGVQPGTLHAAILRSPHAHADILSIDTETAERLSGVAAVLTGEQGKAIQHRRVAGVTAPV